MSASGNETSQQLADACAKGDRRAASRLITRLESTDRAEALEASRAASTLPLPKQTIGLTGPPGAGKSTLLDYLVGLQRALGKKVGVVAVDPSSPFTGGALLGDRIRMATHRSDSGVFIRSMGSRGASGGLAAAASDTLRVLGGAGFECVFIETVGAGQTETEVVSLADSVCVVQVPGLGDDIQLMKMGILEIADVFLVNKADRPGALELKEQIELALHESPGETCRARRMLGAAVARAHRVPMWTPPVLLVSGLDRKGGDEIVKALADHLAYLAAPELSALLRRNRTAREIAWRATRRFGEELGHALQPGGAHAALADACAEGTLKLPDAIDRILEGRP
ncbi:MAG: methylmalonyl Co-A mutase-associated GTPase MeaB [Planctomycetota bacterium]|nr:methylmalonyl Co-A mutase-associated GTPase MeaB [Planctomycetota bacterium]